MQTVVRPYKCNLQVIQYIIRVFQPKMIIEKLDWMPWKPLENNNSWSKEQAVGSSWLRRLLWCLIVIGFLIHFGKYIIEIIFMVFNKVVSDILGYYFCSELDFVSIEWNKSLH